MVFEEIRRQVGDDFIVGFRYVIDEADPAGLSFEECVAIARMFERAGQVDFFNAIYGRMDTEAALATDNMPGMASPIAPWLAKVGAFKREVGLPVFHAARISDIATARHAIRDGLLDMVAMTRAHIADPHIVAQDRSRARGPHPPLRRRDSLPIAVPALLPAQSRRPGGKVRSATSCPAPAKLAEGRRGRRRARRARSGAGLCRAGP